MADVRGRGVACDDKCGCPSPCPGGSSCRCYSSSTGGDDPSMEHKKCPCGEHCGCNPCTCPETVTAAAGCKCAEGCACVSCA